MLLLIDTREPPPEPDSDGPARRAHLSLSDVRPVVHLLIGLALAFLASAVPPLPAFILLFGAFAEIARAVAAVGLAGSGLRDHRQ